MAVDDDEEMGRLIAAQLKAFREKFGREPRPDEPIFFDPENTGPDPVPIPDGVMAKATLDALRKSGAPPEIIYAYKKTGRLLSESRLHKYPPEAIEEWDAAIEEYYALQSSKSGEDGITNRPIDHHAFSGQSEGKMTLEFMGQRVERKIRIDWQYTPAWEHFDEKYGKLLSDVEFTPAYSLASYIWIDPADSFYTIDPSDEEHKPYWEKLDIGTHVGFWGKDIDEAIEEDIERQCREMDAERRATQNRD